MFETRAWSKFLSRITDLGVNETELIQGCETVVDLTEGLWTPLSEKERDILRGRDLGQEEEQDLLPDGGRCG